MKAASQTKAPEIGKLYRVLPRKSQAVTVRLDHYRFLTLSVGTCLMIVDAREDIRMCTNPRTKKECQAVFWMTNFLCYDKLYEDIEFSGANWPRWFEQIGE